MTPDMTIIIADDHPLFRGAMRQALSGVDGALAASFAQILHARDGALRTLFA